MPSAVDRVRFARFVERALQTAKERGMSAAQIQQATGIQLSTIHRWRRGEVAPTVDKVKQFCSGLSISAVEALAAMGMGPREATPAPPMDPDVEVLLQKLADPNVNDATKEYIRQTFKVLAAMADNSPPAPPRRRPRKAS